MDDYSEIYFIDEDDLRNAPRDRTHQDHRTSNSTGRRPVPVLARQPQAVGIRPRAVVVAPTPAPERRLLAGMDAGQLIELATQLFAAIQPLPGAPVAQGSVETDVGNLITYQNALATHAKRDEQLRTIGALVAALVK